jgi:hypothetical protein
MLGRIRAIGLTRPGRIAAGPGDDFAIHRADIPAKPEPAEPNRDLPPEIMRQLYAHLDQITVAEIRTVISPAAGAGSALRVRRHLCQTRRAA